MLKKYSLLALQKAINQALYLDEGMANKLQRLDDKVLELIISPLNVNFYMHFKNGAVYLLDCYEGAVNTTIESNPMGLIRLSLLPASKARSLFNDKVRMSGDVELGQHVKQLFDELDIDWEGHLAHFTGDVVAYQIGSLFRKGRSFKQQLGSSLQQNITEYLQEELRVFPSKNELDDFFHDVDALSLHTERLQAHIEHLVKTHDSN
ncbi:MAG: ubiquinone biosynthesis accessory factor UbiJ [Legionella sp.]